MSSIVFGSDAPTPGGANIDVESKRGTGSGSGVRESMGAGEEGTVPA